MFLKTFFKEKKIEQDQVFSVCSDVVYFLARKEQERNLERGFQGEEEKEIFNFFLLRLGERGGGCKRSRGGGSFNSC